MNIDIFLNMIGIALAILVGIPFLVGSLEYFIYPLNEKSKTRIVVEDNGRYAIEYKALITWYETGLTFRYLSDAKKYQKQHWKNHEHF